jgi:hypothetical protein
LLLARLTEDHNGDSSEREDLCARRQAQTPLAVGGIVLSTTASERTRDAIELMTAWAARPDGPPDLLLDCIRRQIDERPESERSAAAVELIMGMTHLCGTLLVLIEGDFGPDPRETLRQLAAHYAQV